LLLSLLLELADVAPKWNFFMPTTAEVSFPEGNHQ